MFGSGNGQQWQFSMAVFVVSSGKYPWPSHRVRRARAKQSLVAWQELAFSQKATLTALADCEVQSRLQLLAPCFAAQLQAAEMGVDARSSRLLVPRDTHLMATGA